MVPVKKFHPHLLMVIIPLAFSLIAVFSKALWAVIACCVSIFLLTAAIPLFRKRANLWVFYMTGVSFIPINIALALYICDSWFDFDGFFYSFMWTVILFFVLYSVEQVILGFAAALIFPNQVKSKIT